MTAKKIEDVDFVVGSPSSEFVAECLPFGISNNTPLDGLYQEIGEKFTPRKRQTDILYQDYKILDALYGRYQNHVKRVASCGTFFKWGILEDGTHNLIAANFCHDVLCPMCNWRRSLKYYSLVSSTMNLMQEQRFIFVTYTIKNCTPDKLSETCDLLNKGLSRMWRLKEIKRACTGYFWSLEDTYNYHVDTHHPHLHVIYSVNSSYFDSRDYIKQSRWVELWGNAIEADYLPSVSVKAVKSRDNVKDATKGEISYSSAVQKVAEYAVKSSEYVGNYEVVKTLVDCFSNRRKCGFVGDFAKYRKLVKVSDAQMENDLINTDVNSIRNDVFVAFVSSSWNGAGYDSIYNPVVF